MDKRFVRLLFAIVYLLSSSTALVADYRDPCTTEQEGAANEGWVKDNPNTIACKLKVTRQLIALNITVPGLYYKNMENVLCSKYQRENSVKGLTNRSTKVVIRKLDYQLRECVIQTYEYLPEYFFNITYLRCRPYPV